ncbi:MAG: hypothetical protein LH613_12410 [Chamaesiphon sp.]|nr:hypothetical protein [Chamaesiphon sp.]
MQQTSQCVGKLNVADIIIDRYPTTDDLCKLLSSVVSIDATLTGWRFACFRLR